jgi:hypothetical protein
MVVRSIGTACHSVSNRLLRTVGLEALKIVMRLTGRGGPYSSEASRPTHCLDNRLTDGGGVSLSNIYYNLNYRVLHPVARNINCK